MSNDKLSQLIKRILQEKQTALSSRIESVQEEIVARLDQLKKMPDMEDIEIPADFTPDAAISSDTEDRKIFLLHKYIHAVSECDGQSNLIATMIEGIHHFCRRAALFLLRDDKLVGWSGKGFSKDNSDISDDEVKKVFFSLSADTIFKYVIEKKKGYSGKPMGRGDDHLIYNRFGGLHPDRIFIIPFFVKGKPQAVIYTDSMQKKEIDEKEVEILATVGEMSLDLLPFRQKVLARVKTRELETEEPEEKPVEEDLHIHEETALSIKENDPERKARVIINDIILYNQNAVEEGIQSGNLYRKLEDTILQAREEYLRKFNDLSAFEKQLVKTLAKGNKDALKGYKFETL